MVVILLIFILEKKDAPIPDISKTISPSQAYQICDSDSCITDEVIIEGKMGFGLVISDGEGTVFTGFLEEINFLEKIKLIEKLHLGGDGFIKVKVKGKLSCRKGMCTNSGCIDIITIITSPEEIEFIEEDGCKPIGYKGGLWLPAVMKNCFDYSEFDLLASEAYEKLEKSGKLEEGNYEPTGYYDYDFDGKFWRFQLSGGPPGTQFAQVSLGEVTIK